MINIVKVAILPKVIYRFKAISMITATQFLQTLKEQFSISYGKTNKTKQNKTNKQKNPRIAKTIVHNKRVSGSIIIPDIMV
jgi:sortase (surface protein transpeptidase)